MGVVLSKQRGRLSTYLADIGKAWNVSALELRWFGVEHSFNQGICLALFLNLIIIIGFNLLIIAEIDQTVILLIFSLVLLSGLVYFLKHTREVHFDVGHVNLRWVPLLTKFLHQIKQVLGTLELALRLLGFFLGDWANRVTSTVFVQHVWSRHLPWVLIWCGLLDVIVPRVQQLLDGLVALNLLEGRILHEARLARHRSLTDWRSDSTEISVSS